MDQLYHKRGNETMKNIKPKYEYRVKFMKTNGEELIVTVSMSFIKQFSKYMRDFNFSGYEVMSKKCIN